MATLPRTNKFPSITNPRPQSDFDAGINTSTAWTYHLEERGSEVDNAESLEELGPSSGSISDEEPENDNSNTRPARALYRFDGKVEFRELSVEAGDEVEVVKEELADGWSLVRNEDGEVGLLPRTYYTFTSNFTPAPDLSFPLAGHSRPPKKGKQAEVSTSSITPRGSPTSTPIIPQNTGEWHRAFPSFRQSLLGGMSLNRFSSFVTGGAEEWVLKGAADAVPPNHDKQASEDQDGAGSDVDGNRLSRLGLGEADSHFVDAGPAWKTKLPPFRVMVHSPSKRTSTLSGVYTIYNVTSLFHPQHRAESSTVSDFNFTYPASPTQITVHRRFSHFVLLHTALTKRLPGIALPPLPEKQYAGRFSNEFVEARRGDLERYIGRVARHPVARYAEVVTFFLSCENDTEWKRMAPQHLTMPPAGPSFYSRVFHPAFNLDAEEAADTVDRFDNHTRAVGKGVQGLRNIFGRVREARVEMSKAERILSYSLLSLITSKPLASAPMAGISEDGGEYNAKAKGLLNSEGAWCWREGCEDCLKLTKAMQKTSETLQGVADLYDDHARRTQLATHEWLKGVAHPSSLYQAVVDTHRSTLSRYTDATQDRNADEAMAARCETVLNTTMAEMETYHTQKAEDFRTLSTEHLDGEIAFYEQLLTKLKGARRSFEQPQYDQLSSSPRHPSIYERELETLRLMVEPLPEPCPHVFDSAPMRPVSVAVQEGMGMLLGGAVPVGRASVFGKFW